MRREREWGKKKKKVRFFRFGFLRSSCDGCDCSFFFRVLSPRSLDQPSSFLHFPIRTEPHDRRAQASGAKREVRKDRQGPILARRNLGACRRLIEARYGKKNKKTRLKTLKRRKTSKKNRSVLTPCAVHSCSRCGGADVALGGASEKPSPISAATDASTSGLRESRIGKRKEKGS